MPAVRELAPAQGNAPVVSWLFSWPVSHCVCHFSLCQQLRLCSASAAAAASHTSVAGYRSEQTRSNVTSNFTGALSLQHCQSDKVSDCCCTRLHCCPLPVPMTVPTTAASAWQQAVCFCYSRLIECIALLG